MSDIGKKEATSKNIKHLQPYVMKSQNDSTGSIRSGSLESIRVESDAIEGNQRLSGQRNQNLVMLTVLSRRDKPWAIRLIALLLAFSATLWHAQSQSSIPDPRYWVTDGQVNTIVRDGGVVYIGGAFTRVGPNAPYGSALDTLTGLPDMNYSIPNGPVTTVVPDGKGGWFIGGRFTTVYGQERNHLARINGDGSLHPWNPNANGTVNALALSGGKLYVGGEFNMVAGQPRSRIAALDADVGFATSWNPGVGGKVLSMAVGGGKLFIGGEFNAFDSEGRVNLAVVDDSSGALSDWIFPINGPVRCIVVSGSRVYLGGRFTSVQGVVRNHIAAISLSDGLLSSWSPGADGAVNAISVGGGRVYAGGEFNSIGGQSRRHIASLEVVSGAVTAWNPGADKAVNALSVNGDKVYAGGAFDTIAGSPRSHIAALDTSIGIALPWNPDVNNTVEALSVSGSFVYIGGSFGIVGGVLRKNIVALNAASGMATPWNPNADSSLVVGQAFVTDIEVGKGMVYVAGNFKHIGGKSRTSVAAIDPSTGLATAWNPDPLYENSPGDRNPGTVRGLALNDDASVVYLAGEFLFVGGKERFYHLAAVDAVTGLATDWYPEESFEDVHYEIEYADGRIYVTGNFIYLGGETRYFIGSVDDFLGHATDWIPNPDKLTSISPGPAKAVNGGTVYVSVGSLDEIGGQERSYLAALDAVTAEATGWQPNPNGGISALATGKGRVYASGAFTQIGGMPRNRLAAVDSATGHATDWDPDLSNPPLDILAVGDASDLHYKDSTLYAGGTFTSVGRQPRFHFAVFPETLPCTDPASGGVVAGNQNNVGPFDPLPFTSISHASGYEGIRQYRWQRSTVGPNAGFVDIPGSESPTFDPPLLMNTTWYRRLARVDCKNDWSGAAMSNVIEVTVGECKNPTFAGTIKSSQAGNAPFTPFPLVTDEPPSGHVGGDLEYRWLYSTVSASEGFLEIPGAVFETFEPDSLYTTTWYKRLVRVDCMPDWTGAVESNVLQITVSNVKYWIGGQGFWNTPGNWSGGTLPKPGEVLMIGEGNPKMDVDFTVKNRLTIYASGSLTILPGRMLTIEGDVDFGGKSVVFKSDATGTAQLGELTGKLTGATNVTVERYIPATGRRWRLLTAPVDNTSINDSWQNGKTWNGSGPLASDGTGTLITGQQQGNASNANGRGFDFWNAISNSSASVMSYTQRPGQGVWTPLSNTLFSNAFNRNQAYLLYIRGPRGSVFSSGSANAATTLRATGTLRGGNVIVPIDGSKGFTLIGNPYASQIDFNSIYSNPLNMSVIKRQLWMWDATSGASGNFIAVVYSGGRYVEVPRKFHAEGHSSPLTAIQSGHGFFVIPNSPSGGTVLIRESDKLGAQPANPNILLGEDRTPRLFLNLMRRDVDGGDLVADGVMAAYGIGYTMKSTDAEDALKLENPEANLSIENDGASLVADARPLTGMREPISLQLWNLPPGGYRFEARAENMGGQGLKAYLEDRLAGTRTPLSMEGGTTSVDLGFVDDGATMAGERFRVVFEKPSVEAALTPEPEAVGRKMTVYPNPATGHSLTVRLQGIPKGEYTLQLLTGDGRIVGSRRVEHAGGTGSYRFELSAALPKGSYQVVCLSRDGMIGSKRLMLQ